MSVVSQQRYLMTKNPWPTPPTSILQYNVTKLWLLGRCIGIDCVVLTRDSCSYYLNRVQNHHTWKPHLERINLSFIYECLYGVWHRSFFYILACLNKGPMEKIHHLLPCLCLSWWAHHVQISSSCYLERCFIPSPLGFGFALVPGGCTKIWWKARGGSVSHLWCFWFLVTSWFDIRGPPFSDNHFFHMIR